MNTTPYLFLSLIKRVCLFDRHVYNETRHAFSSGFIIVILVALSHGIGGIIRARINNWDQQESFVFAMQGELLFWFVQCFIYYLIGKIFLKKHIALSEILASVGYAIFPGILVMGAAWLQLFGLSVPILVVLAIFRLATCTVALHQIMSVTRLTAFMFVIIGSVISFFSLGFAIRLTEVWIH